ncbi:MAG: T9SS C-terminal target domain-containing protein [Calditrichaeota bacterium]|nr:MAG: T9SS C-terminal target domain-containing protein [Calditrichota bacterium]
MNSKTLAIVPFILLLFLSTNTPAQETFQITRTLNFHLVKEFQYGQDSFIQDMIMSADGSTILFSNYDTKTYVMDADGSNTRLIYDPQKRTDPWLDISADGTVYVLGHTYHIIIGRTDGSSAPVTISTLPESDGNPVGIYLQAPPRITADGQHVYIGNVGGGKKVGGLWRVNANGGSPTQLFSYEQMETQYNIPYNQDWGNYLFKPEFDISDDGSRIIFATDIIPGSTKLMAYNSGALRILIDKIPIPGIEKNAISGDGTTIVYYKMEDGNNVLYSANFDGSNQVKLYDYGWNPPLIKLTQNGEKVFAYWAGTTGSSRFMNTDGTSHGNLGVVQTNWLLNYGKPFAYHGKSFISFDGNRFSFIAGEPNLGKPMRIWVGEINSNLLGTGPTFSNINLEPDYVLTAARSTSTFRAAITGGAHPVVEAGYASFINGFFKNIFASHYRLLDDGTKGDVNAGDGIYTLEDISSNVSEDFEDNPVVVRFSAWTDKAVTEVEVAPFYILENEPSGTKPVITSLSPAVGEPGTQVTIYGTGFSSEPGQNIVFVSNLQAVIISASSTQIVFRIPNGLNPGLHAVTVRTNGQTSNAGSITVGGSVSSLNPPLNLTVYLEDNTALLDWEPPQVGQSAGQATQDSNVMEAEPNNSPALSLPLWGTSPISVDGTVSLSDDGVLDDGFDDIEDLYRVTLTSPGIHIVLSNFNSDCDLHIYDAYANYVYDASIGSEPGSPEQIDYAELEPGTYLIGVSIVDFDPQGPEETPYTLVLSGNFGENPEIKNLLSYNIYRSSSSDAQQSGTLLATVNGQTNFYDDYLDNNGNYFYQVTAVYDEGESPPSNEASSQSLDVSQDENVAIPNTFTLHQNHPNPVKTVTFINYSIPRPAHVIIKLYNIRGQKVRQIENTHPTGGSFQIDMHVADLANGLYIYQMQAGNFIQTHKMVVIGR